MKGEGGAWNIRAGSGKDRGGEKVTMKRNGNPAKGVRRENRRGRVTKEQGGRRRRRREREG